MLLQHRKLLRIDLAAQTYQTEDIDEDLVRRYLGGRGLGSKYLADELDPTIDPLAPENKLIFANGMLTGSGAPTAGRYMLVTKSPLTGAIASSNSGGSFGVELSKAGYMVCIIEGKAETPTYLLIQDDRVEFCDAGPFWGLNTHQTTDRLLEETGLGKKGRVACIGPAGEKLSRIAAVMNEKHRTAARSGVGCVMGSKNLKAIVVHGTSKIEFPDRDRHRATNKEHVDIIKKNPVTGEGLPALGTKVLDSIVNEKGLYPAHNFQRSSFDKINEVNGEALVLKGYHQKRAACYGCPIGCGRRTVLPNGRSGEGPEYETGWAFGADSGVADLMAITEANYLCNELGLDTISAGSTIACAMELYEKGYIPKIDLQKGPELKFGSSEAVVYYTKKMGLREGLGDKLAEGSYRLAELYGHPQYSMSVKKQELPAYDPRGAQGQALSYATSNRGGCHVRGYMIALEVLGVPEKLAPQDVIGKAMWCKVYQDLTAMIDSLGLCVFTIFALGVEDFQKMAQDATGLGLTAEQLMEAGERIWNLERNFNIEAGIAPDQDNLPERFLREPLLNGPSKGSVVKMQELLADYYKARGWTPDGRPKQASL